MDTTKRAAPPMTYEDPFHRRARRNGLQRGVGRRLDQIVVEMEVIAEASAQQLGNESRRGHAESTPPPGVFSGDESEADMAKGFLSRIAELMELDLARLKKGGEVPRDRSHDARNQRILDPNLYKGKGSSYIAHAEGVPERVVLELRKYGREKWEVETA